MPTINRSLRGSNSPGKWAVTVGWLVLLASGLADLLMGCRAELLFPALPVGVGPLVVGEAPATDENDDGCWSDIFTLLPGLCLILFRAT